MSIEALSSPEASPSGAKCGILSYRKLLVCGFSGPYTQTNRNQRQMRVNQRYECLNGIPRAFVVCYKCSHIFGLYNNKWSDAAIETRGKPIASLRIIQGGRLSRFVRSCVM